MYSVYQHWDPLKVCAVGRSYPPEFYSWITVPHVRSLFEKIAIETEEDYQNLIKKLQSFGVKIIRTELPERPPRNTFKAEKWQLTKYPAPPMCPRDHTVMLGNVFYCPIKIMSASQALAEIQPYSPIAYEVASQGNEIRHNEPYQMNGAYITRIGKDLYFGNGAHDNEQGKKQFQEYVNQTFTETRNHFIDTDGHSDGVFCPVCPGLIVSIRDIPTYKDTFPGWEVVYLPNQSWEKLQNFLVAKVNTYGRWWIPGFEHDQAVIDTVETWLKHWTGYVEETVFDVNMLIVDPKNVIVFSYNKQVFDALERYGITPHIVPIRHRYFWDGGIHCMTSDLHREGVMQDYFPERG